MLLANNLKFLRKRHGYTQSQVALLLEINRSTYAYYELGRTRPRLPPCRRSPPCMALKSMIC